eukprot:tig00000388_g24782.t1
MSHLQELLSPPQFDPASEETPEPMRKPMRRDSGAEEKVQISDEQRRRAEENRLKAREALLARLAMIPVLLDAAITDIGWRSALSGEFDKPYFKTLAEFLRSEVAAGKKVFPRPSALIFNALNLCPLGKVKVVIIGQDPYHGDGQAHGLCFSVPAGISPPPSLVNIFQELESDIPGFTRPKHGNLEAWASQGVLLLNTCLTVEAHKANSHNGKGWEKLTDKIVEIVNSNRRDCIFLCWGNPASMKAKNVDSKRHLLLKCPHPSPLSAYRGFLGSKHFSQANAYLVAKGLAPIEWRL